MNEPRSIAGRMADLGRGLDRSLALLAAIAFVTQIGVAVMLPLLPLYASRLGAEPIVLGFLTSSFAITNAVGQLAAGSLAGRFGPRRLIPAGMAVYAGANLLIATAAAALPLILWRSIAGLGGGLSLISERLYVTQVVDRSRLAFANGLMSSAGSAGTVLGPAVAGLLVAVSDLRVPFLLVAVTSAIATAGALFLPRPRVAETGVGAPDVASAGAGDEGAVPPARRDLAILLVANIGLLAGFGSFITTYAPYTTSALAWTEAEVGITFSLFGLGSIVIGPWLGHQADRRGRRQVAAAATAPIAVFAALLLLGAPRPLIWLAAIPAGGGVAGFGAAWYALLASTTGGVRGSRAFGTVSAISSLGIAIGAMAASVLWTIIEIRAGVAVTLAALAIAAGAMLAFRGPAQPARSP
jgi:DHA1 family multidrug resistance protein-like MFS transporter